MIKFSLKCAADHVFEEWFSNGADYDEKAQAGSLACPSCGDTHIAKSIMAPNIGRAKAAEPAPSPCAMGGGCQSGMCAFAGR
ncbi:MAG: DUF1178 family protein [Alphaproteobacteria bacterium]|nr:DUF1178 family protein [Alphaproteobacteria bacterium]MBF0393876.1 DUF1178 family protein [Alphaproteobacteria bacterium]